MINNTQALEKRVTGDGSYLAVNSIFHTIQGEGPFAGTPAVFVRLAGCNLQCPMCDTEYTKRTDMHLEDICQSVHDAIPHWESTPFGGFDRYAPTSLVVITGGEPFRQPIGLLAMHLSRGGYRVQIETNGTLFQPALNVLDPNITIVCSPKTGKVNALLEPWIKAYKYVATADSLLNSADGLPLHALEHPNSGLVARPLRRDVEVYLQPVDEQDPVRNQANLDAVVESCLHYGHRLCLQVHKLIGVP